MCVCVCVCVWKTFSGFSPIFFSRNDVSGKRFREAEGEASPQSPPAGALLLKKKENNHGPTFSIRLSGSSLSGCARQRHPIAFQSFQDNSPFSFLDFASFLFTFFSCTLGVQACTTGRRSVLPAFSLGRPQGGSDLRCFPICRSVASRVHSRLLRASARSRCAARRRRLAGSGPLLSSAVACELSNVEDQLYDNLYHR